jgi:hypothetical protein
MLISSNPSEFEEKGERRLPSVFSNIVFRFKASILQAERGVRNLFDPENETHPLRNERIRGELVAESVSRLWSDGNSAEFPLTAGKIENLRVAAKRLNGVEVPSGKIFSFWAQLGKASKRKGYVEGRELREGCLIPSVGGGLCQLSNALYDAALKAGFEILERHAHSRIVPGSLAELGRDATVFWNYVDLRFRSERAFRIEVKLDSENLIVRFFGKVPVKGLLERVSGEIPKFGATVNGPNRCETCGVAACFRSRKPVVERENPGRSVILLDRRSPEFEEILQSNPTAEIYQLQPSEWFPEIVRRISVFRGVSRAAFAIETQRKLARQFSKKLTPDVTELVVIQGILPFLFENGDLGGRVFDVFMSAPPMWGIHERLDLALSRHPESKTLGDFRAPEHLVELEREALRGARRIFTANPDIAAFFPEKAIMLPRKVQEPQENPRKRVSGGKVAFPASTLGRKGAFELREALRGMNVTIVLPGNELEGPDFWDGFAVERRPFSENWLKDISAVVLPAYIENDPRKLLEAVSGGVPVIASTACGLQGIKGVVQVEIGDVEGLRAAIGGVLKPDCVFI